MGIGGGGGSSRGQREMASATKYAADLEYQASQDAIKLLREQNEQARSDLAPWREHGMSALRRLRQFTNDFKIPAFDFDPRTVEMDPGYQFRKREGMKQIRRGGGLATGTGSGAHQKAMQRFAQDYASGEYDRAYGRTYQRALDKYRSEVAGTMHEYGVLANQAGLGHNVVTQQNQMGQQFATQAGQLGVQGAGALGAGRVGAAQSQINIDQQRQQAQQQSFNNLATMAGLGIAAYAAFSDRRLKTDIEEVGKLDDGLKVYKYRFKGDPKPQIGVMAQDVEKVKPSAVVTHPTGAKMVDYSKVGRPPKIPRHMVKERVNLSR